MNQEDSEQNEVDGMKRELIPQVNTRELDWAAYTAL